MGGDVAAACAAAVVAATSPPKVVCSFAPRAVMTADGGLCAIEIELPAMLPGSVEFPSERLAHITLFVSNPWEAKQSADFLTLLQEEGE